MRFFFDVDGVLIDGFHTKPERRNRWDKNLERDLGIKPEAFQKIFSGWFLDVLHGRLDFGKELCRWLEKSGHDVTAQDLMDYWHEKDSVLNRPVFDVVRKLSDRKDSQLYTATNQTHERIAYLKDTLNWKKYFADFYYSARLGCLKSDPRFFERIETELAFDPYEHSPLYFDDDPKNIEIATARGWNAVLVDGLEDVTGHPVIKGLIA